MTEPPFYQPQSGGGPSSVFESPNTVHSADEQHACVADSSTRKRAHSPEVLPQSSPRAHTHASLLQHDSNEHSGVETKTPLQDTRSK